MKKLKVKLQVYLNGDLAERYLKLLKESSLPQSTFNQILIKDGLYVQEQWVNKVIRKLKAIE